MSEHQHGIGGQISCCALGRAQWTFDAECQKCLCVTFDKSNKNLRYARFTRNKKIRQKGKQQEVDFIVRSVSATLGEGCLTHNDRSFTADNVDGSRTHLNIAYVNEPIKEVYHKLFDEALEKYNAKQTRNDRKIADYYEKIRTSKQEKLFHEIIIQVGNCDDMSALGENAELAKKILDEYFHGFRERNHTLHVFSAHLHMDEATPHLHIDFIPLAKNSKRGLETRVSLKQALKALGFEGEGRENTEGNQWANAEKKYLAEVMKRYGVQRAPDKNENLEHLSVLDYKKQERSREVEQLTEQAEALEQSNAEAQRETAEIRESLEKMKAELSELTEDKNEIDLEYSKYFGDGWELPEPSALMSAKTFRNKHAIPLISKLKEVIQKLIVNVVEISRKWKQALWERDLYWDRYKTLERENEELQNDARSFHVVRSAIGTKETDDILRRAEEERKRAEAERIAKEQAEQEAREREREERRLARLQLRGKKKSRDERGDR